MNGTGTVQSLRKYIDSLGATTKAVKGIEAPTETKFISSDVARDLYGIDIEEDWTLKLTPNSADERGYVPSLVTPQNWEITENNDFVSPDGERYTREEFLAQIADAQANQADQDVTQAVFGRVFQDKGDIDQIISWANESDENLNQFYQTIMQAGRTPDTEQILKTIGASDQQIAEFFFKPELIHPERWPIAAFVAGIGDLMTSGAGLAEWMGSTNVAAKLRKDGADFQAMYPEASQRPDIFDDLIRTAPMTLALIPAAIAAAYGGVAVAGAAGLGALGSFLLSSLGAGAAMRVVESGLEAGGTYEQAKQMGLNDERADEAATETFKENLKLTGLDWAQVAIAFAPTPAKLIGSLAEKALVKTAIIGGKVVVTGLTEGGEELYQQMVQNKALGLPVVWDSDEMRQVFLIGAIYGGAMGAAGTMFTEIQEKTKNKLPDNLKETFEIKQKAYLEAGLTKEQARLRALDDIVKTGEGKQVVSEVIEEVKKTEAMRDIDTSVKSEALIEWLGELGYTEADIGSMTAEQAWDIGVEGTPKAAKAEGAETKPLKEVVSEFKEGETVKAIWRTKTGDNPIEIEGILGEQNGVTYYRVKGTNTGIPENEIIYGAEAETPTPQQQFQEKQASLHEELNDAQQAGNQAGATQANKQILNNEANNAPPPQYAAIQESVNKLLHILKVNENILGAVKIAQHEELVKRAARVQAARMSGDANAIIKAKAALKGKLTQMKLSPKEVLEPEDILNLKEAIRISGLRPFEWLNATEALDKLLLLERIMPSEQILLERVFGPELTEAIAEQEKVKAAMPAGAWNTLLDIANIPRALLASMDIGHIWRQAGFLLGGKPLKIPVYTGVGLRTFASGNYVVEIEQNYQAWKYKDVAESNGLYHAPVDGLLSEREETFISKFASNIPWVKWAERSYVGTLNKIRQDFFDAKVSEWEREGTLYDADGKPLAKVKSLAHFLNTATGRGSLGPLNGAGAPLAAIFFSPRLAISRIQLPFFVFNSDSNVRAMWWKSFVGWTSLNIGFMMLAKIAYEAFNPDEEGTIELDPRSVEFGKLKIGNTRYDPWGGSQPLVRYMAQVISGYRETEAGAIPINRADYVMRLAFSKLAPIPGLVWGLLRGKSFIGREYEFEEDVIFQEVYGRIAPFAIQDMLDAISEHGLLQGTVIGLPAFFGMGVLSYDKEARTDIYEWLTVIDTDFQKFKGLLAEGDTKGAAKYIDKPMLYMVFDSKTGDLYSASARILRTAQSKISELEKEKDRIREEGIILPWGERQKRIDELESQCGEIAREAFTRLQNLPYELSENEWLTAVDPSKGALYTYMDKLPSDARKWAWDNQGSLNPDAIERGTKVLTDMRNTAPDKLAEYEGLLKTPVYQIDDEKDVPRAMRGAWQEYQNATTQSERNEILKKYPELKVDADSEYLKSHPEEEALLVLLGRKSKVQTQAAYDAVVAMAKKIGLPEEALGNLGLPPKKYIDADFTYTKIVSEHGANSAEAKLFLTQNSDYQQWRKDNLGQLDIETPTKALEISVKWADLDDQYASYSDRTSPNYIETSAGRTAAREKLLAENSQYRQDRRRRDAWAIDGVTDKLAEQYVEYYEQPEGTARTQYRVNNRAWETWMINAGRFTKPATAPKPKATPKATTPKTTTTPATEPKSTSVDELRKKIEGQ